MTTRSNAPAARESPVSEMAIDPCGFRQSRFFKECIELDGQAFAFLQGRQLACHVTMMIMMRVTFLRLIVFTRA